MKVLSNLFVLFFLVAFTVNLNAQVATSLPGDPNAVYLGTMMVDTRLVPELAAAKAVAEDAVTVWRTSAGGTQYVLNTSAIRLIGDDAAIDTMTSEEVYDNLSYAAVIIGARHGFMPPCSTAVTTKVWSDGMVMRTGSGVDTRFSVVDSGTYCDRKYTVYMPSGADSLTVHTTQNTYPCPVVQDGGLQ